MACLQHNFSSLELFLHLKSVLLSWKELDFGPFPLSGQASSFQNFAQWAFHCFGFLALYTGFHSFENERIPLISLLHVADILTQKKNVMKIPLSSDYQIYPWICICISCFPYPTAKDRIAKLDQSVAHYSTPTIFFYLMTTT